jgi:hypothetical protein
MSDSRLVKSGDLAGVRLDGKAGAKLGAVREVYLDLEAGTIRFVLVETAGFFGVHGRYHPIPWALIRFDPAMGVFTSGIDKDSLKAAPNYEADQLANPSYGWGEQVERYFSPDRFPPAAPQPEPELRH